MLSPGPPLSSIYTPSVILSKTTSLNILHMLTTPKYVSSAQSSLKNVMAEATQTILLTGNSNWLRDEHAI